MLWNRARKSARTRRDPHGKTTQHCQPATRLPTTPPLVLPRGTNNFPLTAQPMPGSSCRLWTFWFLSWSSWTAGISRSHNDTFTCLMNSTDEELAKTNQRLQRRNIKCSHQCSDLEKLNEALKRQAQGPNPRVFVYDMPASFNEDLLVKNPFCTYVAQESWQSKYSAGYERGARVRLVLCKWSVSASSSLLS